MFPVSTFYVTPFSGSLLVYYLYVLITKETLYKSKGILDRLERRWH